MNKGKFNGERQLMLRCLKNVCTLSRFEMFDLNVISDSSLSACSNCLNDSFRTFGGLVPYVCSAIFFRVSALTNAGKIIADLQNF